MDCGYTSLILPEGVVVQAEVNKRYQNIPNLKRIPDFLFHKPGYVGNEFAVVEFKRVVHDKHRNIDEITKDLKKLANFRKELHYAYLWRL